MVMDIYFWDTPHPVYLSLIKTYSFSRLKKYKTIVFLKTFTNHLETSNKQIKKDEVYITKSPIISLFTWKLKFNKAKFFVFEEYFERKNIKDLYAKFLISQFKEYPFIAMTKRTKRFLEKNGIKVFFIPPAEKKRNYSFKRRYITMVSRLVPSKNITLFLKLAEIFPNEEFLLIGKGELKNKVIEYSKKHKNLKYIEFVERRKELFKYYAKSKLLIHPVKKDPIGFVIIEALSTSTPVISSSSAGASDFLPKEWVLNTFDINAWKKKIEEIIVNNEENVHKANETFIRENLDIESPYFDKVAKQIRKYIEKL